MGEFLCAPFLLTLSPKAINPAVAHYRAGKKHPDYPSKNWKKHKPL
jgi:hypothetical protein